MDRTEAMPMPTHDTPAACYSSSMFCASRLFVTIALKCPSCFVMRFCGVSSSAMWPSSRTRTRSESMMVFSLCAMVSTVESLKFSRIISWIIASVSLSILAVASSMTNIFGFRSSDRAMHSSCRWPCEKFSPPSATISSRAPGSSSITWFMRTFSSTSHSSSSLWRWNGSRLYRTVLEKITGSCGMMERLWRRHSVPICFVSTPSMMS
mmetsp:Transcript_16259/g.45074  ORF Transcript_16259/g.45074 Transcript_16259/m.45074 type:complete len:208 (+) Transcript_16259:87-710(+)